MTPKCRAAGLLLALIALPAAAEDPPAPVETITNSIGMELR